MMIQSVDADGYTRDENQAGIGGGPCSASSTFDPS